MKNNSLTKAVTTIMPILILTYFFYGWYQAFDSKINEASDKFAFAWIFFVLYVMLRNQQHVFDSKDK